MARDIYERIIDDLITIIDAMHEHDQGCELDVPTLKDLHDIAHVLTGGDRTRDWPEMPPIEQLDDAYSLQWYCGTPAGPDVWRRMAEVLERAKAIAPEVT